jgi:phosphotransacetylase
MGDPRSKLDILYQDVLGEVSDLVTRIETAKEQLANIAEQSARSGERTAEQLRQVAATAAGKLKGELEQTGTRLIAKMENAAKDTSTAAALVHRSARRFATLALTVGLAAGVIGGALAGLVVSGALL